MNSHPPTNEISVGGLGESGPDVAVEIWQIGIFSNLSAHRATSVHLLKLWDNFCKRGLVFQITSTFLFNKHPTPECGGNVSFPILGLCGSVGHVYDVTS